MWEPDRSVGALDDGEWIGATGAYTFDLTLPGGTHAAGGRRHHGGGQPDPGGGACSPSSWTGNWPTSSTAASRWAILTASESLIYGRYGYGLAVSHAVLEIDSTRAAFRPGTEPSPSRSAAAAGPSPKPRGRCRRPTSAVASCTPGQVTRNPKAGGSTGAPRTGSAGGTAPAALYIAVHEDGDGQPDGFVSWRVKEDWTDSGLPKCVVVGSTTFAAVTAEDRGSALAVCSSSTSDEGGGRRSARWTIRSSGVWPEPRSAQTNVVSDWLGSGSSASPVRLETHGYQVSGQLVVDVHDPFRPSTGGRYLLDADPKSVTCTRTDAEPDLAMEIDDLGAIYLGGVAPSLLAAAGRIKARSAEVLARADDLFRTTPGPFSMTGF